MRALVAVLLLTAAAVGICGAALALGDGSFLVPPPEARVEQFVRQLEAGRFGRAVPYLSGPARARTSPASLEAAFHDLEGRVGRVRDVVGRPLAVRDDTAWVEAILDTERAEGLPLPFRLVREKGLWAVDGLDALGPPLTERRKTGRPEFVGEPTARGTGEARGARQAGAEAE
jgi:hypothetical protein